MYLSLHPNKFSGFLIVCLFCFCSSVVAQQKADFAASVTSACDLLATNFKDLSTGNPVSWQWDFGNGNSSPKKDPGITYIQPGKYTVTLKVTYADGSTKTETKTNYITVRPKPVADFSISEMKGCVPFTTTFTDKSTTVDGSLQSFSWDFGDGEASQNGGSVVNHVYNKSGVYGITLTVTDNHGCFNYKVQDKAIDVVPPIVAGFSVTEKTLCKGPADVLFQNTSTGPGTLAYKWEFDDGSSSTLKDPGKHTFQQGQHRIKLTVTNERGCANVAEVNDINVANYATDFTMPALMCSNEYATFNAVFKGQQPNSTLWEFNDQNAYGNLDNATYIPYNVNNYGPINVRLTATYGQCKDVVEKKAVIQPAPTGELATNGQPSCSVPSTVQFKSNMTGASSWKWEFGDGQTSVEQNPSHIYQGEGNYHIILTGTSSNGCSAKSYSFVPIYVTKVSAVAYNTSGCEEMSGSFGAFTNNADQIVKFEWDFGDGSPVSNEATPNHVYKNPGTYQCSLQYTTAAGCTGKVLCSEKVQAFKKPVVDFSSPDAPVVCGNSPVTFYDKSDVAYAWRWEFGDGGSDIVKNGTHGYSEPGVYDVTLTVWNGSCSQTLTKKAYIKTIDPFPRFTIDPVDCAHRNVVTVSDASLGATGWKWNWGDGKDTSYTVYSDKVSHYYAKTGEYIIRLTTTAGNCTTYKEVMARVFANSPITITTDKTTFCSEEVLTTNLRADNPSYYYYAGYRWQLDGNDNDYQGNYVTQFRENGIQPGKHTVTVKGINDLGCTDISNPIAIDVRGVIADYITPGYPCKNTEVTFVDNSDVSHSSGIVSWEWDFREGDPVYTFKAPPFKHTYKIPGYYQPSVTVTDKQGCKSKFDGKYFLVNGPTADFEADNYVIAPGSSAFFRNTSGEVGGYISDVAWNFGDNSNSQEYYSVSHYYPTVGIYPVTIAVKDNNGCKDEITKNIKVAHVGANFTYTSEFVNGGSCAPMIFRFTNTSLNQRSNSWDFGDGGTSDQLNPVHTYVVAGHYTVTLKVTGEADTEDTYSQTVIVTGPYATIKTSEDGGCLEKEITFTIQPENATTFSWDFTDGNVEQTNALEIKHHFTEPGIYKPRLLMSDAAGCRGSALLDHAVVIDKLDIQLHPSPEKICDEGTLTFAPVFNSYSVDDMGIAPTYTWAYDASLTPTGINTLTPSFYLNKTGVYTFGITATTKYGCTQTVNVPVNVYPTPLPNITAPDDACKDAPVNFSGSVTSTSAVSWRWDFGNGKTSTQQQPDPVSFPSPGITAVKLTVTSKEGCANEVMHPITVLPLPDIKASAPAPFICAGNATVLHAGGGGSYEWTPVTGLSNPTAADPIATPLVNTNYQVKVTGINGCIAHDAVNIRVVQPFHIRATPDTVLCLGDKFPLWVSGTDLYTWKGPGIDQPYSATPVATLTSAGQYTYEVTGYDKDNCFSDHLTLQARVHPLPTVNVGPDRELMAGVPLYLIAVSSNDVIRWRWTPADYLDCATCSRVQALPNLSTTYRVTVENVFGCKAADEMTLHILCNQSAIYMPNAFTPNHDGRNERIYPKGKGVKEIEWLRIYDRWGTLVFENTHFPVNVPTAGWDGRRGNKEAPLGSYIYSMQTICESGEKYEFKGNIILIK